MDGRRPVYFPADYNSTAPQQQQPLNPNFVSPDSISLLQNLAYSLQFQTPLPTSFPPPNSNYYYPINPSNFQVHPNFPQFSSQYNPSAIGFPGGNSTFRPPPQVLPQKQKEVRGKDDTVVPKAALPQKPNVPIERIDQAVIKARHDLLTAKENVSAWKVSQAVLVELNVDSWSSLGFQMQEVPSLYRLIVIEGKINSFIHCFVGVQRITSLHDLEVAICKSEGIGKFEELELGPLVRHPLAVHYFSISSDVTEVFRITTEDVIIFLSEFTTIRREIKLDELLDYIAKKRSVNGKEKLGIRIQSLGMHISCIREAKRSENITVKKFQDAVPPKSRTRSKIKSRPLFSSLKKKLDVRFGEISERLESFSSDQKKFCGKHIKFRSSSSEEEDTDDNSSSDKNDDDFGHNSNYSIQTSNSPQKGSRCPYPSQMEEMSRLGLKSDRGGPASSSTPSWNNVSVESSSKKRQLDKEEYYLAPPAKALKRDAVEDNLHPINDGKNSRRASESQLTDHILSSESIGVFISTWKEACSEYTVAEVLEKMLMLYHPRDSTRASRRRNGWKVMFSKDPFIGLLNVAVASIKYGMWDSIYDTFEAIGHHGLTSRCESIDVEPSEKDASVINVYCAHGGIKAEEVIQKLSSYLELDNELQGNDRKKLMFLRKLFNCQSWLADEFCVKEFSCLSQGEFFTFLEKHASLLPLELLKLLTDDIYENIPLEVCIPQHILTVLLSQASSSLGKGEIITKPRISTLVNRQFPLLSLIVTEDGSLEALIETMERYKSSVCSTNVLFSATLFQTRDNYLEGNCPGSSDSEQNLRIDSNTATSKDAIKALLQVPMLKDLSLWSHWDIIYAPSLGPLLEWLLKDVNAKDLLCLVTADSKVIRLDNSATIDSYLEAAVKGLPFQTAVQLLSLFALAGGERHFPASLLKCHAQRAFKVISKSYSENMEGDGFNKVVNASSQFFLECLGYLPSDFWGFAADVLLSGMRPVIKDSPCAILLECSQPEQRQMLHHIGLSLGIAEWTNNSPAIASEVAETESSTGDRHLKNAFNRPPSSEEIFHDKEDDHNIQSSHEADTAEISIDATSFKGKEQSTEVNKNKTAESIIVSIRRDEFGLDQNLSDSDSIILKKQHARLGRALHCLSHELYSQDSHFLLELVQNADDNIYTGTVKPTLAFILHKSGIIVLNNEEGFSGENIRALCDVGNSTKKGSGAGYIGKKGIGFKSVFRVTDSPEIHSNGFHVKFDIGEGQIGFVLPTLVPSCDIESYSSLVDKDNNEFASDCWNTCIVLPFRKKLTEETAMNTVVTMFSDLNPSLLLFLHRLQCIKFRNLLNDSFLVMRKEIVGDGIIRVSCGEQQMTWFVASQRLQSDVIRRDVQTTEISIAFTLQEADDKTYIPCLELQPVFAFLPLRTYGLKFILQGDFVLPSSREEVDGDSPWNQWLLSEFPGLFVNGERSFCALPCFRENLGKAVAAYLSFIPLVGEVHGFFSSLPRMIISRLRMSNCLLLDGEDSNFVPPCKVLRGWNKQARILLSDSLLREHLGCGFLHRDIVLSDSLARALGIEEYGPRVLLQILTSLCCKDNGLKSMGLSWLASFLDAFYTMILQSSEPNQIHSGFERDLLDNLQKISFIPLSDGTYSCISKGTIWLHSDALNAGETGLDAFPGLSATLRTVSPALLTAPSFDDVSPIDMNLTDGISRMLYRIGVQQLSAHGIIKHHILPAISDDQILNKGKDLILDYLCFVMIHLQSSCPNCRTERGFITSELQTKAVVLTNHGFKRPIETSIHFSKEFGNPLDMNKLVDDIDMEWLQVDTAYLNHPAMQSLSLRLSSWRGFLQEMGITDFVKVIQVDKRIGDMPHSVCKDLMLDNGLNSPDSVAKDWESSELVSLLSLLSVSGNRERSIYLLEILDSVWDACFSDKTTGHCSFSSDGSGRTFRSSFISKISDIPWVVSSMDNKLHYPKDLFHGSDAVISLLGDSAPYVVPKVRSENLLAHIGFKTKVTLDDILDVLKVWRRLETPFKASIEQMSRLYTFIWNEMAVSRHKIAEVFESGPFIFVPFATGARVGLVSGTFMPSKEVYWQDSTGATDHLKNLDFSGALGPNQYPLCSTLCNIYPGLHQFFVRECGVNEIPPFQCHLRILQQLATASLPCQAASVVFQVFLKWNEELKCGSLTSRDINHLKESLVKLDYTVLPTVQDKWVSLHSSYGLVCWCDDKKLKKRFKHLDNINFLYFGERSGKEQMLRTKVSVLMQNLGIPALSDVVTREAIHHGSANSSSKVSLVKWALPFAQRYMYSLHTDKYLKLKQSGFNDLSKLRIVVVEKLFYKNVIKRCGGASSKKQFECSCLLQDNVLYSTQESDSHSLFLELSRLFFDGNPELQLANFLLMITKMAETGSSEEQIGLFILNSQKVRKLPDNEDVWFISSASSVTQNQRCTSEGDELNKKSSAPKTPNEQIPSNPKSKGKVYSWPPGDWKTAPDFSYARASGFVTWGAKPSSGNSSEKKEEDGATALLTNDEDQTVILTDMAASSTASVMLSSENMEDKSIINALHDMQFRNDNITGSSNITPGSVIRQRDRDSLITSTPDAAQAQLTGRAGEQVAYMYMSGLFGKEAVNWVNEEKETGLPYDLVVDKGNNSCEYIEVKATRSAKKDWFEISTREWQFAVDNGESFSILHVVLGGYAAKISKFENPFRLCQHRKLQLVVMMTPKDHS